VALRRGQFPQFSEEELVLAALVGDFEAFDELVRRYRGAVVAIAEQAVGSREAAEDVAQEAFLLAFKALPQLDDPGRFGGWLCAITKRRAWRVASQAKRSEPTEPTELDRLIIEHSDELGAHPAADYNRKLERTLVQTAINKLSPEHQMVIRLRYYEEWPVERIAAFLSLPVSTVKWRLHHGRKLMKRQLEKQQEVRIHERNEDRGPQNPPGAARDSAAGPRRQHDGKPRGRKAQLFGAIQFKRALSRKRGRPAGGLVPAFA